MRKGTRLNSEDLVRVLDYVHECFEIGIRGDFLAHKERFNLNFFSDKVCGRKTPGLYSRVKKINHVDLYKCKRYMSAQFKVYQKVYEHDLQMSKGLKYTERVDPKVDSIALI